MTAYQYTKQAENNIWHLSVEPMPDWEDFHLFTEQFLLTENAKLIDKDYGMDRHQVRFRIAEKQYVLQFEHYSGSIWVEQDY